MFRHVISYGVICGVFIGGLKLVEYRWLVLEHSIEIYGAIVALVFAALGIWLGLKLTRPEKVVEVREVRIPVSGAFERDDKQLQALGITPRELEMLEHVAAGLSNREIAARVFVSENTVKTHLSRLFDKLGAARRTQAVQRAKELRLIA
jgi:DNA-binding CsgD family transcriptional regulator